MIKQHIDAKIEERAIILLSKQKKMTKLIMQSSA